MNGIDHILKEKPQGQTTTASIRLCIAKVLEPIFVDK